MILFGESVTADVIQLKIWREDHLGLCRWFLGSMTNVLKRYKEEM